LRSASSLDQRQAAFREVGERAGYTIDALDADRLQIRAEHRLDGSLPTVLDDEVLSQSTAIVERLRHEPAVELLGRLAERRFLQRLERGKPAAIGLQALAKLVEVRRDAILLLAKLLDLRPHAAQCARRVLAGGGQPLFVRDERL